MKIEDVLIAFVEGSMDILEFERFFFLSNEMEPFLKAIDSIPEYVDEVDLYQYLIRRNFKSPGDAVTIHSLFAWILEQLGVPCKPTKHYERLYDVLLKVQPKWLDVPSEYLSQFGKAFQEMSKGEFKKFVSERLRNDFCYEKTPPKWIQNPTWPMANGVPLKFLDQKKIDSQHDETWCYRFSNGKTGEIISIFQSA